MQAGFVLGVAVTLLVEIAIATFYAARKERKMLDELDG